MHASHAPQLMLTKYIITTMHSQAVDHRNQSGSVLHWGPAYSLW